MHTPATSAHLTPAVFAAFKTFINQKPNLEPRNYYDPADINGRHQTYHHGVRAYRAELARISKDGTAARKALAKAQEFPFDAVALMEAFRVFSGRLEPVIKHHNCTDGVCPTSIALNYTTGQYFPTEYRAAALAVLTAYIHAVRPKFTPAENARFTTVSDLARANEAAGGHWFSKDNKRFFRSRIVPTLYHGNRLIWFVSTEKRGFDNNARVATVRVFDPKTADVATVPEFGEYDDTADARSHARDLVRRDKAGEHIKVSQNEKCPFCGHYGGWCSGRSVEVTGNPNAVPQYAAEHGCRTFIAAENRVCMAPEIVIHDGRMYCDKHKPTES